MVKYKTVSIKRKVKSFLRDKISLLTEEQELDLNLASFSMADAIAQSAVFIKFREYDCEFKSESFVHPNHQSIERKNKDIIKHKYS